MIVSQPIAELPGHEAGCELADSWVQIVMKRILSIFFLLIWSVGIAGSAVPGDRVWCTGSDGHVGIEASIGTHCTENPFAAKTESPSIVSNHCGSCKDVSLTSSATAISSLAVSVPAPVEKAISAPYLPGPVLAALIIDQPAPSLSKSRNSSGPSPRLLEHRSVVLLI